MNSEWEDNLKETKKLKTEGSSVFYDPVNDIYRVVEAQKNPVPDYKIEAPRDETGNILQEDTLTYGDGSFNEKISLQEETEKPTIFKKFLKYIKEKRKEGEKRKRTDENEAVKEEGHIILTRRKLKEYQSLSVLIVGLVIILSAFFGSSVSMAAGLMTAGLLIMSLPLFIKAFKSIIEGVDDQYCYISLGVILSIISAAFSANSMVTILCTAVAVAFFDIFEKWKNGNSKKSEIKALSSLELPLQNIKIMDDEGVWNDCPQESIKVGQNIAVSMCQYFPVDCTVLMGEGTINQKAVNGTDSYETVTSGNTVLAGTLCGAKELICKATSEFDNSLLAKRNKMLKDAQNASGSYQENIMRILKYFSFAFCVMALPVIVIPSIFAPYNFSKWLGQGISVLVAASPAALYTSVLLSYRCGIVKAANEGVVIRGYRYLELLAKAKSFVFTKNGVISTGKPKVNEMFFSKGAGREDAVKFLTAIEGSSDHPTAKAILKYSGTTNVLPVTNVAVIDGKGICADCGDDKIVCGSIRFLNELGIDTTSMPYAGTILAVNNKVLCGFSLTDFPQDDAFATIKALRELGIEDISMVTGDCRRSAYLCAQTVGIKEYKYELIPDEKVTYVAGKKFQNGPCVFVGNHETDNAVLSASDVGVSMGFTQMETKSCPVLILNGSIASVANAVSVCQKTLLSIKKSMAVFFLFKLVIVVLALLGMGNIFISIILDVVISVFCTAFACAQLKEKKAD